jgi:branched-subunit amino acid transport protein
MRLWLVVAAAGIGTYGIRLSVMVFVHHSLLPRAARDALRFVTPAVLLAIILPAVLYAGDPVTFDAGPGNERLVAALVAAAVAWAAKNIWLTIGSGMAMLWLLRWAGG